MRSVERTPGELLDLLPKGRLTKEFEDGEVVQAPAIQRLLLFTPAGIDRTA